MIYATITVTFSLLIDVVNYRWRNRKDFFAGGNMFIYYSLEQVRRRDYKGPDFFLVKGIDGSYPRQKEAVMSIPGRATPEGTAVYAANHPSLTYNPLNATGWLVSQAGFGCYRVHVSVETHDQALRHALLNGINLIDTSSNYGDGGSEELVGAVVGDLVEKGQLVREAVVVVSKVGYLQGQNYELSQQRKAAGNPFPDLVEYDEGLEHCIHPEFLADQFTRSLQRLNIETVDGYLLHNPEYYLAWAQKAGVPLAEARAEYYRRIELAFHHLESEVAAGRIQYYGISSNTFPNPAGDPEFTSLERVWQIAEAISPDHRFRLIQLPLNLLETGGATEKNQSNGQSVREFAGSQQLGVLVNRPLNAIRDNRLIRLAGVPEATPVDAEEVSTAVDTLAEAEEQFRSSVLPTLPVDAAIKQQLAELLSAGRTLQWRWHAFGTYHNWQEVRNRYLLPRVQTALQFLSNRANLPHDAILWLDGYGESFNRTMKAIKAVYAAASAQDAAVIEKLVQAADAEWGAAGSLSQMAIRALRSTAGVTTVLVGMRRPEYVDDVLVELAQPVALRPRESSWQALAASRDE